MLAICCIVCGSGSVSAVKGERECTTVGGRCWYACARAVSETDTLANAASSRLVLKRAIDPSLFEPRELRVDPDEGGAAGDVARGRRCNEVRLPRFVGHGGVADLTHDEH